MNKDEMETNPSNTVPVLGSARGLVTMHLGWDEPMSSDEVEEVFCLGDGADGPNHP
jgi:hypothetical protein